MRKVFVISKDKRPLMPCHPARARELLRSRKAAVFRLHPFTLILKHRKEGAVQKTEVKLDPGFNTSGVAVVIEAEKGRKAVWVGNLEHRGMQIRRNLLSRRQIRRSRRNRKTRYRQPRFLNRTRTEGWLPPSLESRVNNVQTWGRRLTRLVPVTSIVVETVRFDTHKLHNPEVKEVAYQQGTLFGYEVREYLLEKWGRKCVYCGKSGVSDKEGRPGVALEVEHIVPKAKGGTDNITNLALACEKCNRKKGTRDVREFLKGKPEKLQQILKQCRLPLRDAAAVNASRYKIGNMLKAFNLPVDFTSGGITKYNRVHQGYRKDHWIDACCAGDTGNAVYIPETIQPVTISAQGHGNRLMCRMDKFGFPITSAKSQKTVKGFRTGDFVKAVVTKGKKIGTYRGKVSIRATGSFNIKNGTKTIQGISYRYCSHIQKADGYSYQYKQTKKVKEDGFYSPQ